MDHEHRETRQDHTTPECDRRAVVGVVDADLNRTNVPNEYFVKGTESH